MKLTYNGCRVNAYGDRIRFYLNWGDGWLLHICMGRNSPGDEPMVLFRKGLKAFYMKWEVFKSVMKSENEMKGID